MKTHRAPRRSLHGFVAALIFVLCTILVHTLLHDANGQAFASPPPVQLVTDAPHMVRVADAPVHVFLPDGHNFLLPRGAMFAVERYEYHLDSRVMDVHGLTPVFRDGFED